MSDDNMAYGHNINCKNLYNDCSSEYEDIFEGSEKQLKATRLFQNVLETRETLLEDNL